MNTSASSTATACPYLCVEGLDREARLYDTFSLAGAIRSVQICGDITGRSLGCAYVSFHHPAEAEHALDAYYFYGVWGRRPRISSAQRQPVGKVIVKNLEESIDSEALNDTMSVFGNILSCQVAANGSRGYAVVQFQTQEAADRSIDRLNGLLFNDQQVYLARFSSSMEPQPQTVGPMRSASQVPRMISAQSPRPAAAASVAPVGEVPPQSDAAGDGETQRQTAAQRIAAQRAAIQSMGSRRPRPAAAALLGGVPQNSDAVGVGDTQRQMASQRIAAQRAALQSTRPRRLRAASAAPVGGVPQQSDATGVRNIPQWMAAGLQAIMQQDMTAPAA